MSPLLVKYAGNSIDDEGRRTIKYWMKTKTARPHHAALQKVSILLVAISPPLTWQQCILAYISDTHLYATLNIYCLPYFLIMALSQHIGGSFYISPQTDRTRWAFGTRHVGT